MNDSDYFFEQCKWLVEANATARALAIVTEEEP